jgi:hypothetical protein
MNMEASWQGASYGEVKIHLNGAPELAKRIIDFNREHMEAVQGMTRAEYIQSLELAAPAELLDLPVTDGPKLTDGKDAAFVDAGSVTSFVGGLSAARQADVLNSTLLAQLAANKKFNRESETEQWYGFYREVLENVGWVITSFAFQRYSEAAASLRMDKAALDIIAAIATGNELLVLKSALSALSGSDGTTATIFDTSGSTGENGNFQLASCTQDATGNVATAFGAFYFKADRHVGRFLFWSWETKSINMYFASQGLTLNENVYSTVRAVVIDKLGSNAKKFVAELDI